MVQSAKIDIFFSCSFDKGDAEVNEVFLAICRALDMNPTNVSTGSSIIPPEVAKIKIAASQAFIAVCTRRDELKAGGYIMPQAVQDEMAFAYGKDIPVLMIKEGGVDLKGFKASFGTYLSFMRADIFSPEFLQRAIEAIHGLKLLVVEPHQVGMEQGISDSHAEYVHHLVELKALDNDYTWSYSTSKKLIYTKDSKRAIPSSVWATVPMDAPEGAPPIQWLIRLNGSSRGIKLEEEIEEHSATCVKAMLRPQPPAEEGDYIDYSTTSSSRYINPVWQDECLENSIVHLDRGDFRCADGLILIHRTKKAIIEFRFAAEYGIRKSEIVPFVGSYTSSIDYEVESELKRTEIRVEDFGGNLIVRLEVESPLPGHIYGIAWNPKPRPASHPKIISPGAETFMLNN